jgi:hypothetical protein
MQRMRHLIAHVFVISTLVMLGLPGSTAKAALIHPNDTTTFPDLSAGYVSGTVNYSAATGVFQVQNVPFALALGPNATNSYDVTSTSNGLRSETLTVTLDKNGNFVPGTSDFSLYGQVTIGTQTFSGLLLKGTVYQGLGSLDLSQSPTNVAGASMFDLDIKIDKSQSLLGQAFSSGYAYLRLAVERGSTFNGSFASDFAGYKVGSNIRSYDSVPPAPVPEPTTLVVLVAAGAGLLFRHRRRIDRAELEAKHLA